MLKGLVIVAFFVLSLPVAMAIPWVGALLYAWVEYVAPQSLYYSPMAGWPAALMVAAITFVSYVLIDRRHPPAVNAIFVLMLIFAVWVTITLPFAELYARAFIKWDKVIKVIGFTCFISYLIRTRVQIEAFVWGIILAVGFTTVPSAAKTIVSGGGGFTVISVAAGTDLAERNALALVSAMLVPICVFLYQHTILLPRSTIVRLGIMGLIACYVLTVIGTLSRAGLLALGVSVVFLAVKSRQRFWVLLGIVMLAPIFWFVAPAEWFERMSTITDYEADTSSMSRIRSWQWGWEYALARPIMGGGFRIYEINPVVNSDGVPLASHSFFFEVLGEQGFVGLALFMALLLTVYGTLWGVKRRSKGYHELSWAYDLATMIQVALVAYVVGGAFSAVAFESTHFYLFALTVSLQQYLRRVFAATERLGARSRMEAASSGAGSGGLAPPSKQPV